MLLNILAFVGAGAIVLVAILVLIHAVDYHNDTDFAMLTVFNFGVIVAHSARMRKNLNILRGTTDKRVFITAPKWFNKIWNIGGAK